MIKRVSRIGFDLARIEIGARRGACIDFRGIRRRRPRRSDWGAAVRTGEHTGVHAGLLFLLCRLQVAGCPVSHLGSCTPDPPIQRTPHIYPGLPHISPRYVCPLGIAVYKNGHVDMWTSQDALTLCETVGRWNV